MKRNYFPLFFFGEFASLCRRIVLQLIVWPLWCSLLLKQSYIQSGRIYLYGCARVPIFPWKITERFSTISPFCCFSSSFSNHLSRLASAAWSVRHRWISMITHRICASELLQEPSLPETDKTERWFCIGILGNQK